MAGVELATAYVSLIPSLKGLRKELAKIHDVQVDVEANTAGIRQQIQAATSGITGNVKVEVHKSAWQRLKQLSSGLASVSAGTAKATVGLGVFAAATGSAVNVVGSLGAGLASTSGALLALPAVAGAGATAFGALRIGVTGFGETMKQLAAGDMEKFNEALGKLSPNAQRTALAIKGLSSSWTNLRKHVQDQLFAGMASQIKTLGGTYIPILRKGLGQTAEQINLMAQSMGTFLQTASAQASVTKIMASTTGMFANMRTALRDLVAGLLDMAAVGSSFLPQFGSWISKLAAQFRAWAAAGRETGSMADAMRAGFTALANLGRVLGNVAMTVVNVFKAMNTAGGELFGHLVKVTGAMKNWTASARGQAMMGTLFQSLSAAAAALAPYIKQVAQFFGQLTMQIAPVLPQIARLAGQFISALLPVLQQVIPILVRTAMQVMPTLTAAVQAAAPGLVQLAQFFAQVLTAVAPLLPTLTQLASSVLSAMLPALAALIPPLVQLAQVILPPLVTLFRGLAAVINALPGPLQALVGGVLVGAVAFAKLRGAISLVKLVWSALSKVFSASPIGRVIAIVGLLATALVTAYKRSATFRRIVDTAFRVVGNVAKWLWNSAIKPAFSAIGKIVGWLWRNIIAPAAKAIGAYWRGVGKVIGAVGRGIGSAIRAVGNVFRWLLDRARSIGSGIRNAWNGVMNFFRSIPGRIGGVFRNAGSWLWNAGKAIIEGFVRGLRRVWERGKRFVSGIGRWIKRHKGPLSYDRKLLLPAGDAIMSGLHKGLLTGFQEVQKLVSSVAGAIQQDMSPTITPTVEPKLAGTGGLGLAATVGLTAPDSPPAPATNEAQLAAAVERAFAGMTLEAQIDRHGALKVVTRAANEKARR